MTNLDDTRKALQMVIEAATIHGERLMRDLKPELTPNDKSFNKARRQYVAELAESVGAVKGLKLDDELKVIERVRDLELGDAVDLLHAVQAHIMKLRSFKLSEWE